MTVENVITIKVGSQEIEILKLEWNLLGPSDTAPTPTEGFTLHPTPIELDGIKLWIDYKIL